MGRKLSEASTISHRFANQVTDVDAPVVGYGIFYVRGYSAYFRPWGGDPVKLNVAPINETNWNGTPDSTLSFAGQLSNGNYREVNGDEFRKFNPYAVTGDISVDLQSMNHFVFEDATDRTVTITSTAEGQWVRAYAMAGSGGTGHKILLPALYYWGDTGTNRAALLNAQGDYIDAILYDTGVGGVFRMLIYGSNSVSFAAS